jgi:hypothetical protein
MATCGIHKLAGARTSGSLYPQPIKIEVIIPGAFRKINIIHRSSLKTDFKYPRSYKIK